MNMLNTTRLIVFSIFAMGMTLCSMAQDRVADNDTVVRKPHTTFRDIVYKADSLRLRMRSAADSGLLLQWADSLLGERRRSGEIDEEKYRRWKRRLARYDKRLFGIDSLLSEKYNRKKYDTMYVARPQERWTFKLRTNISGARLTTIGWINGIGHDMEVRSDYRATLSLAASYRGLSLGLSLNPAKLAGKNKDYELNVNSYGNRMGFDIVYLESATYHGSQTIGGETADIDKGDVEQRALNVNFYYAFNSRRFSFPAAFSQSYIQLKSAGSWIVGASADLQQTDICASEATRGHAVSIRLVEFAVGGGYGYNYVPSSRWLFHWSALPTLTVVSHDNVTRDGQRQNMKYSFPGAIITGRVAATYSWGNKFLGLAMVYNHSVAGSDDNLRIRRDKWRLRCFVGFRW